MDGWLEYYGILAHKQWLNHAWNSFAFRYKLVVETCVIFAISLLPCSGKNNFVVFCALTVSKAIISQDSACRELCCTSDIRWRESWPHDAAAQWPAMLALRLWMS